MSDDHTDEGTPSLREDESTPSLRELDEQVSRAMDEQEAGGADLLQEFWMMASRHARLGDIEVFMGTPWGEAMVPQAWSFGDNPEMADRLAALVVEGHKTATTGLRAEYAPDDDSPGDALLEPLPRVGDLSIILDGSGIPRALIREAEVVIAPFCEITEEQAAAEGEGDRTLDSWRADHRAFWERTGTTITDSTLVVWERFKVLHAA